jgi:hypothetical protein
VKPKIKKSKQRSTRPNKKQDIDDPAPFDDLTVEELYGYDDEYEKFSKLAKDCEKEDCYD